MRILDMPYKFRDLIERLGIWDWDLTQGEPVYIDGNVYQ